jgi:MurNAc alpha-1-phosphate uridylyltransferase
MKAMILAAGRGERMQPLTETTPKPLLRAGGKPLIEYHIERLAAAGWRNLVINHAWLGDQIETWLGDGARFGVHVEYSREGTPLETAGGIRRALDLLTTDSDWFLVVNADIWTDFDPADLPAPPTDALAWLVLVANPPHHPEGDFMLAPDGRVHPAGKGRRLTFSGISLLHRDLFANTDPHRPAKLAPLLREAMNAGRVRGHFHTGHWYDIGTPERLAALDYWLGQQKTANPTP